MRGLLRRRQSLLTQSHSPPVFHGNHHQNCLLPNIQSLSLNSTFTNNSISSTINTFNTTKIKLFDPNNIGIYTSYRSLGDNGGLEHKQDLTPQSNTIDESETHYPEVITSVADLFDLVLKYMMKGKKRHKLVITHQLSNSDFWPAEYLDDGYNKTLNNAYKNWRSYIKHLKAGAAHSSEIRDLINVIYGAPGSGKSRFVMEFASKIEKYNENMIKEGNMDGGDDDFILPIVITFNSVCQFDPKTEDNSYRLDTKGKCWIQLLSRVIFSLLGDNNNETFCDIEDKFIDLYNNNELNFLSNYSWNIFVKDVISYMSELHGINYNGCVLLIDEVLNTSIDENSSEMHPALYRLFRKAWDNVSISRKELSFIFTTLNSYSWIKNQTPASKRGVRASYLPHFNDETVKSLLLNNLTNINIDNNNGDNTNTIDIKKALYASTICNYQPRLLLEILSNFNDPNIIKQFNESDNIHEKILGISDERYKLLESRLSDALPEEVFFWSFTNPLVDYNASLSTKPGYRPCDFVALGSIIPTPNSESFDTQGFDREFNPTVSLLSIWMFLNKSVNAPRQTPKPYYQLHKEFLNLMTDFITVGEPFEKFQLLFETMRYNGTKFNFKYNTHKPIISLTDYFINMYICKRKDYDSINLIFKSDKKVLSSEKHLLSRLMVDLDKTNQKNGQDVLDERLYDQVFLLNSGGKKQQQGFDSIIIYQTENDNERLWIFFESRYMVPKTNESVSSINYREIGRKYQEWEKQIQEYEEKYEWFKNDKKLLLISSFKEVDVEQFIGCNRAAFLCETMIKGTGEPMTKVLSDHFGPSWTNFLGHSFAYNHALLHDSIVKSNKK